MTEERSTVRSRQLGYALRSAMTKAGLTGKSTASMLDWSESRVSRFLTGKLPATEVEVASMAAVFGVTGAERDRLLYLTRDQVKSSWPHPEQRRTLADHQYRATRITEFSALTVPALLQTADYASSVFARTVTIQADEVESLVAGRIAGQRVFDHEQPPQSLFFINDAALRLPVGSKEAMSTQLHHLLSMTVRSHIAVRVIPTAAGAHAGLAGSCCLMEFAEFGPVVALQHETGGHFLEDPADVAVHEKIFSSLAAVALGKAESHQLIRRLAVDVFGPTARNTTAQGQRM
ncbi:MAG TPA: helix-turn-helix transcriptional regulator [Pseudonocardiaceae bacterium]|nr:helix-turn-helix transcriptional regulator [Pseudonocardiaceae bacterium]